MSIQNGLKRASLPLLLLALSIMSVTLVTSLSPVSAAPTGTYFDHVVIIAMENQPYSIFTTGQTPFENSLLAVGASLSQDDHYPTNENCSAGCYVAFTTGSESLGASQGDGWSCCIVAPNIIDQLKTAGLSYQLFCTEGCPRGLDHFPFPGYSSLQGDPNILEGTGACSSDCRSAVVSAANSASPPNYIWFTPTDAENMHDGSLAAGDSYLKSFLVGSGTVASPATGSLLASNLFTSSNYHTLLWIWWDECGVSNGDGLNCDGNSDSPNVYYGKMVKPGFTSSLQYNEYSELATIENNWGLPLLANAASPPANANGAGPATISDIFGSSGPLPLSASFTYLPTTPIANTLVTFTASASGGTAPYSYSWSFGDGSTATGSTPTHTYASSGNYNVTLTVMDSASGSVKSSQTVQVSPVPALSASFTYSPSQPTSGQTVMFTGSATGGTSPYSYSWNFGDGSSGTGLSASHSYSSTGTYTVILTVGDSASHTASATKSVTVTAIQALATSFTYSPSSPTNATSTSFSASATGGVQPYSYSWNFGDGTTGSGQSVSHLFNPGTYTVTLTATDSESPPKTATSSQSITVTAAVSSGNFGVCTSLPQGWNCGNASGQGGSASATITNGVAVVSMSNVGGDSNNYGFATTQKGTFPWSPCSAPASGVLPAGITTVTTTFTPTTLPSPSSGSRYHIYVALYYWLPNGAVSAGSSTYQCLDTQVRVENIGGTFSQVGSTATYDPGDSFGWDQVAIGSVTTGSSYTLTANVSTQCQSDEAAWGIPTSTPCQLAGIEIGIEGYQFDQLNVSFSSVGWTTTPPSPDFTISATSPAAVNPSQSASSTITITPENGFTGTVALTDSVPSGLTCGAISPTTLAGSGTATVSCSATAGGTYTLTVIGTSGSLTHSATTTFAVNQADFTVTASAPAAVNAGQSSTTTITITALNGFTGTVSLTDTAPIGLSCGSISSTSIAGSGTATISCTATNAGSYSLTITGTSGSLTHSASTTFNFRDFTISASSPASVSTGSSGTSTITITALNRFSGTVTISDSVPSGLTCGSVTPSIVAGSGTATLSCSSNNQGVYTVTITGTSGSLTHQTTTAFTFGTPSDFTITATSPSAVNVGSSAKSTITITMINGLTGTIALTDSAPSGLNCGSISSTSITANGVVTVSCSSSSASTYTLTVTGTSGSLTHTATATFTFYDFGLSANPSSLSINTGGQGTSTISLNLLNGFSSTVMLTLSSPTGVAASLSTSSISGSGTSTLSISPTNVGSYTVVVTGTSGSLTRTISVTISVGTQASPVLTAPATETLVQTSTLTFTVTGTDSSVPTPSLTLSANQLPSDASFATVQGNSPVSGTFTWTPTTRDAPGTYTVSFTITDGVSVAQTYVVITLLSANVLPIITVPGPQNATIGGNLHFTISGNDPTGTGGTVILSATGLASNMAFDPSTGAFSFTPSKAQAGQTYMVNFTATDSSNPAWTKTESVPIHVQATTSAPSGGGCGLGCLFPTSMTTTAWLVAIGALIGIVSSIALLHIRASAELAAARKRVRSLNTQNQPSRTYHSARTPRRLAARAGRSRNVTDDD
jgi:PKD repeat protein